MERYRQALAQYMAEQQPMRMAEGGATSLTQADYDTFVADVYANVATLYAGDPVGGNQYIADRINASVAGFDDAGLEPNMGMLKNAIESVGASYGQDRAQLDQALYVSDQALEPLGYDLGTYTPIDPVDPVDPVVPVDPIDPVDPEPPTSGPTIGGGGDNIDIGGGDSPVTVGDDSDVTVDVPVPDPEPLTLDQSNYDAYTQSVFDRSIAGQITPDQIIQEISSGFQSLQDQGYTVEPDKLRSSVETVWNRSSTGADVDTEINNALFALDDILEPAGLDIGNYTFIDTPVDPGDPGDPVDPSGPEDPVDPVDTVPPTTAETISTLIQQAEATGDYTGINQFLADQGIEEFALRNLYFADLPDDAFQAYLDAGVVPFGYAPPDTSTPGAPTAGDISEDFYRDFQTYYERLDRDERGSLASELESYVAENLDVGDILASAGEKSYEFGGGYGGSFEPEVYNPGIGFAGYRAPQATGINVRNPFGQYTLSEAESQRDPVAPVEMPTFSQAQFRSLNPVEQKALIRDAVSSAGINSPSIPEAMLNFGVLPGQLASAIGAPMADLPSGLLSIAEDQFESRTIPGVMPSTFIPQVGDITPLSGVSSGLPSLGAQPLPTYSPISFAATPEQVAAATIGAMNAAEAEQS